MTTKNVIFLGIAILGLAILILGFMGTEGQGFFAPVNQYPIGTTVIGGVVFLLFLALSTRPPQ